jgi:hypothetical protein
MKASVQYLTQCASTKVIESLQRVENQTMRLVTRAVKSTSCESLRYWLGMDSIRDRQTINGAKELIMRIASTPSRHLHHEVVSREDELTAQRLNTVRSWISYSRDIVEYVCPIENLQSDECIDGIVPSTMP